ncbi:MAG: helix-turn-helix domain-containing protein [Defluviitaleaceae bacterium]|nr:helix-turn-helix domain-containing protein [Defluviitaleaceae bacterium]
MKQQAIKEDLIKRYMTLTGDVAEISELITSYEEHLSESQDTELSLILSVLKAIKADNDNQGFETCCQEAAPIFEHFESTEKMSDSDLHSLVGVIGYHPCYRKTLEIAAKAMKILDSEPYSNDNMYKNYRTALNLNLTLRLLRAKYLEPNIDEEELKATFDRCYTQAKEVFANTGMPKRQIIEVRKGVFENNPAHIREALSTLRKIEKKSVFRAVRDEIVEYLKFQTDRLGSGLTNFLSGYQIRLRREALGLTLELVASALGIEATILENIETGREATSWDNLRELCKVLHVNSDYIFFADDNAKKEISSAEAISYAQDMASRVIPFKKG